MHECLFHAKIPQYCKRCGSKPIESLFPAPVSCSLVLGLFNDPPLTQWLESETEASSWTLLFLSHPTHLASHQVLFLLPNYFSGPLLPYLPLWSSPPFATMMIVLKCKCVCIISLFRSLQWLTVWQGLSCHSSPSHRPPLLPRACVATFP